MKVGFIGYGSMGSMLLNQMIVTNALEPDNIIVYNRTAAKLAPLSESYPAVEIASGVTEVAAKAKVIFLCTKAPDALQILEEIKGYITPDTHLISISGAIKAKDIQQRTGAMVSKLIPAVTSEVLEGVSLVYHKAEVHKENAEFVENLLRRISQVKILSVDDFALITEITSCGPGLLAGMFREMLEAAARHSDLYSRDELQELLIRTLYGTAKLFLDKGLTFDNTISRVAVKGGITEEGILVFQKQLPNVFNEAFDRMLEKRKASDQKIEDIQLGTKAQ